MIELKDLHKNFGTLNVLNGVNYRSDESGVLTILGPNGSGKTTLIKIILGMVIPNGGEVLLNGITVSGKWQYRNQIDYLPQIARFPDNLTVMELIGMIKKLRTTVTREAELIQLFKVEPYLFKKLGNLSGGSRQKVNLILAFMFDSPMIILDEPTSGLDPASVVKLKKLIEEEKKRGKLILVTTHILSFVEEVADNILFLMEGKVYFKGSVQELKDKTKQVDLENAIANILEVEDA